MGGDLFKVNEIKIFFKVTNQPCINQLLLDITKYH